MDHLGNNASVSLVRRQDTSRFFFLARALKPDFQIFSPSYHYIREIFCRCFTQCWAVCGIWLSVSRPDRNCSSCAWRRRLGSCWWGSVTGRIRQWRENWCPLWDSSVRTVLTPAGSLAPTRTWLEVRLRFFLSSLNRLLKQRSEILSAIMPESQDPRYLSLCHKKPVKGKKCPQ